LAEKSKFVAGDGEDEEFKDLPAEEFVDFHSTYSEAKWWGKKLQDQVEIKEEEKEDDQV